jgi:hypothetical protein
MAMRDQKQYRLLTPNGRLSHDTFVVASEQPKVIQENCVLVVDDRDGRQLTVHRDRLFLTAEAGDEKRACLRCGRVLGVVEDQVHCPYDEANPCELLEPPRVFPAAQPCAEHSH